MSDTGLAPTPHEADRGLKNQESRSRRTLLGVVLGLPIVLVLMLLSFVLPAINSGPHDLPLAVSGDAAVVTQFGDALESMSPGAFDLTVVEDSDAVTDAVLDRRAVGGLVFEAGERGPRIEVVTASGAGSPYAGLLKNLATGLEARNDTQVVAAAKAQGADAATLLALQTEAASTQTVMVSDLAPMSSKDPMGTGLTALGMPLVFGGMASGVILSVVVRTSMWKRVGAVAGVAVLGALAATLVLDTWLGAIAGSFALTWAGLSLGIAAISLTICGLHALLGYAGLGLGVVLMLFVSNPLSGLATGPLWLPAGWGTFGQMLPVGATGTWLRSAAYFDGAGMGSSAWVLGSWLVCGLLLLGLGKALRSRD